LAGTALGSSSRTFSEAGVTTFYASEFVTENDTVVVFGFESGTVKTTGDPFRNEWAQKYVVRDDLITEMDEYNIQVTMTS
jgi:ketosteroid isomerase-like protein